MKYKKLGSTNIELSAIALGTMTWGEQNTEAEAFEQMDYALESGVNFFDTAEIYPIPPKPETAGLTETYLGNWLADRNSRKQIFLASKVTGRGDNNPGTSHLRGGPRLSAKHIAQAIDTSLQRLKTDYIDLYQVHWPERRTNFFGKLNYQHLEAGEIAIKETLEAMAKIVNSGKARYIGVSNETPWGVMEYSRLAKEQNLPIIQSIQNPYNLLNRSFEIGLSEIAIREQVSLLAYSPLAFGTLTGKYLNNQKPKGSRMAMSNRFTRYSGPVAETAIAQYAELARDIGITPTKLALAFINSRDFVTSSIIGATRLEQLKENVSSIDIQLDEDTLKRIEKIEAAGRIPCP